MSKFWEFRNQTAESAELFLYGDIASEGSWFEDEITPKQFAKGLAALGAVKEIHVRINSGGGDVFAAQAIGNLLEANPATVTAYIDGLCASAATIIACHCNKVIAANDSTYMIHPIKMGLFGYADVETLQQYIDALHTLRENVITLYAKKTGCPKDEVAAWVDATSWWTGLQAKEKGFVDELTNEGESTRYENRGGLLFVNCIETGLPFDKTPQIIHQKAVERVKNCEEEQDMEQKNESKIKTVDDLHAAFPELVDQIEQAATNAERARIKGIEEGTLTGGEALAAEAKYEKPMSIDQFNAAMLQHIRAQGAACIVQMKNDAERGNVNSINNAPPAGFTSGDEFMAALKNLGKTGK